MVNGFPQEPFYKNELQSELKTKRLQQLEPDYQGPIDIAIPLGGASSGMLFLADTIVDLKKNVPGIHPWTVFKDSKNAPTYSEKLAFTEADIEKVFNNDELVDALGKRFASNSPPTLVMVKPGELSNLLLNGPDQVGGAILLFTDPVGDQEVQNKRFFQSPQGGQVLPKDDENNNLIHLLLSVLKNNNQQPTDAQQVQLDLFAEKAQHWRGVSLPKSSYDAALFIYGMKKFGILKAMDNYKKPEVLAYEGQSANGSLELFAKLDTACANLPHFTPNA